MDDEQVLLYHSVKHKVALRIADSFYERKFVYSWFYVESKDVHIISNGNVNIFQPI